MQKFQENDCIYYALNLALLALFGLPIAYLSFTYSFFEIAFIY